MTLEDFMRERAQVTIRADRATKNGVIAEAAYLEDDDAIVFIIGHGTSAADALVNLMAKFNAGR